MNTAEDRERPLRRTVALAGATGLVERSILDRLLADTSPLILSGFPGGREGCRPILAKVNVARHACAVERPLICVVQRRSLDSAAACELDLMPVEMPLQRTFHQPAGVLPADL